MHSIDLNCDMGESFGAWTMGQDEALMEYVTSVNIACGFHAGDPTVMRRTVEVACSKNVGIGAHPGYADLQGFGRREIKISTAEVYDLVVYQVGALSGIAKAAGTKLTHVKPHGALYNAAAKDPALAHALARAVKDVDDELVYYGLAGSVMLSEATRLGLRTASEVFADRTYQPDGTLTPRTIAKALIESPQDAARQVLQMILQKQVTSVSGTPVSLVADTVCIHGDSPYALQFAKEITTQLRANHVVIQRP